MSLHLDYIGIDIAKAHLDVFDPVAGHRRLANTPAAIADWIATLAGRSVFVVLEATGHYDSALRQDLHAAGLGHARANTRYRAVFNRLVEAGKPKKLALIAVARKLLVTLNAMLRDKKPYAS